MSRLDTDFSIESLTRLLTPFFTDRSDIEFALLFGSRARGDFHSGSDIDIGIHYTTWPELLDLGFDIFTLEELTGIKTDVLVLNNIPNTRPELAYEVAKDAVLIHARERKQFVHFKTRCFLSYFDFKPVLDAHRSLMEERIKNGTYGRPQYAPTVK